MENDTKKIDVIAEVAVPAIDNDVTLLNFYQH
jgi:hypothetical protein